MSASWIRVFPGGSEIDVLVSPRASRSRVGPLSGDRLKISVSAPPAEGEANAAVLEALAEALAVARRKISIARGASSRRKSVRILGVSPSEVACRLSNLGLTPRGEKP